MSSLAPLIAVLDDEPEMRKALERLLLACDFGVTVHATGDDLLASLSSGLPDCVVLDLHMSGVNGFDVLAQFASRWPHVPIVVITGHHESDTAERVRRLGAAAYLRKPVDETALLGAIETTIRDAKNTTRAKNSNDFA